MLGMFFNPLGFDVLFKMVLDATNSYWMTTGIFYFVAALFFGLYFYFSGTNPIIVVIDHFKFRICQLNSKFKKKSKEKL